MNTCSGCGNPTLNPKYCTRSCAATNNNHIIPRRKPTGSCKLCGSPVSTRKRYCPPCKPLVVPMNNRTVGSYYENAKNKNWPQPWVYNNIRTQARYLYKKELQEPCQRCGYKLHVELAHITPISSFPLDTPLSVVNARTNVLFLCPNCHWEFDKKLWSVEGMTGVEPAYSITY